MIALVLAATILASPIETIDGDTIDAGGQRIRIANIDAPELGHAQCDAEKRLGTVAKRRLASLLEQGTVTLIPGDPKDGRTKDRHGRLLGTLSVDGQDIGEILITEGLARPWTGKRQPWCE